MAPTGQPSHLPDLRGSGPVIAPVVEVGRLRRRLLRGQQLTGIDRVTSAYLRWCLDAGGHACVTLRQQWRPLPAAAARRLLHAAEGQWNTDHSAVVGWRSAVADLGLMLRRPVGNAPDAPTLLINTSQSGLQEAALWRQARAQRIKVVAFIHDLIPLSHPEYSRAHAVTLHRERLRHALRSSAGIIVNSGFTRDTLQAYANRQGLPMPPCAVLHLGTRMTAPAVATSAGERPYFIILGTLEPRKNHLLLLEVWKRLVETSCTPMPRLLIIGKVGWNAEQVERFLAQSDLLRPHVERIEVASDARIAALLCHARALLFPSFVEGYGLPLVEALSLGTPVIASPLPPFVEVAGAIPEYADPLDGPRWQELIARYAGMDPAAVRQARPGLAGYRAPTWSAHFAGLEAFLESLC